MKKIYIIGLLLISFLLQANEILWDKLPQSNYSSIDSRVFDRNNTTFIDITGSTYTNEISYKGFSKVRTLYIVCSGEAVIRIYDANEVLLIKESVVTTTPILKEIQIPASVKDKFLLSISNTTNKVTRVHEIDAIGNFIANPVTKENVNAVENIVTYSCPDKKANEKIKVIVHFNGAATGFLAYSLSGIEYARVYVSIKSTDSKDIQFESIPYTSYGTVTVTFEAETGSLTNADFIVERNIVYEPFFAVDITKNVKDYSTDLLVDNDVFSEMIGQWNEESDERVVDILFNKPINAGKIFFYFTPGFTEKIDFEGILKNGNVQRLGVMDSDEKYFNGTNDVYKEEYEYLSEPGYKIIDVQATNDLYKGVRLFLKKYPGSSIIGGIGDIKVFSACKYVQNNYFIPTGSCFISESNPEVMKWDNETGVISRVIGIFTRGDKAERKFGYPQKCNNFLSVGSFIDGEFDLKIPVGKIGSENIPTNLDSTNVFSNMTVPILLYSKAPLSSIKINGLRPEPVIDPEYNLKKDVTFTADGYYLVHIETNAKQNKLERIDKIFIDTTAPEIVLTYPTKEYVNNITPTIRGYIRDLTPTTVTVNGINATMTGRYFEVKDVEVSEVGDSAIVIIATDSVGHTSKKNITVKVDNDPPVVNIISPESNGVFKDETINIQLHVEDKSLVKIASMGIIKEGVVTGDVVLENVPVVQGKNSILIKCIDQAGNETVSTLVIYIDRNDPIFENYSSIIYTNKDFPDYNLTILDEFDVSLLFSTGSLFNEATFVKKELRENGLWATTFSYKVNIFGVSSCLVSLKAVDIAGNETNSTINYIKDNIAPVLSNITPIDNFETLTTAVTINGSYLEENLKSIKINGISAIATNGTFYLKDYKLENEGINTLTIVATDKADNQSSVVLNINRDTTPPANPLVHVLSTELNIGVYWESEIETKDISYYNIRRIPAFKEGNKIHEVEIPSYTDSGVDYEETTIYTYYIQSVDRVGNKSEWKSGSSGRADPFVPNYQGSLKYDGMELAWDGNECSSSINIQVHAIEEPTIKDSGMFYSPIYKFGPEGVQFMNELRINYSINKQQVEKNNIKWHYFNEETTQWERIPTWYDSESGVLVGEIYHFSSYALKEDRTREFEDNELSALNSTRQASNVFVNEADGSVIISESDLTLKGPGNYDFSLTRSISSNKLIQTKNNTQSMYDKYYPKFDTDNIVVGCYNYQLNEKKKYVDIGGWETNIPKIQGETIFIPEGSINIGVIPINKGGETSTSVSFEKVIVSNKWFKIFGSHNGEVLNKGNIDIKIMTSEGIVYEFEAISGNTNNNRLAQIDYTNFSVIDKNIFFTKTNFARISKITYPDGSILNFKYEPMENKTYITTIYWNDHITKRLILSNNFEKSTSILVNEVTKERIFYSHDSKKVYAGNFLDYRSKYSFTDSFLSSTSYSKDQEDKKYIVNYTYSDYITTADKKSMYTEKLNRDKNVREKHQIIITNTFDKLETKIIMTDSYEFKEYKLNKVDYEIGIVDEIKKYKIIEDNKRDLLSDIKYNYRYEKKLPSSIFRGCEIATRNKDNIIIKSEIKEFNDFGMKASHEAPYLFKDNFEYYGKTEEIEIYKTPFNDDSDSEKNTFEKKVIELENGDSIQIKKDPNKFVYTLFYTNKVQTDQILGEISAPSSSSLGIISIEDNVSKRTYRYLNDLRTIILDKDFASISDLNINDPYSGFIQYSSEKFKFIETEKINIYISIIKKGSDEVGNSYTGQVSERDSNVIFLSIEEKNGKYGKIKNMIHRRLPLEYEYEKMNEKIVVNYMYDSYGRNIQTSKKIIFGDNSENELEKKDIIYFKNTYKNDEYNCLSLPKTITTKYGVNQSNKEEYVYTLKPEIKNYQLSMKKVFDNDQILKTEEYVYNTNNKLESISRYGETKSNQSILKYRYENSTIKYNSPLDELSIVENNIADAKKYFIRGYSYLEGTDLLMDVTDDKKYKINFEYDFLGRNKKITIDNSTNIEYDFDDTNNNYIRTIKHGDIALKKEKIDYFDNKINKITYYKSENEYKSQDFSYDELNRKLSSSDFKSKQYYYTYNNKQRIDNIKDPLEHEKKYSYKYVTIDISDFGITNKITALRKRIVESIDNDVEIYKDSFEDIQGNNIAETTKNYGELTLYNSLGKPEKVISGLSFEEKDGLYVLIKSKDTYITSFNYDSIGRLIKTIYPEIDYNEYSESIVPAKGALQEEFLYNYMDMVTKKVTTYPDTAKYYQFYSYDAAGNLIANSDNTSDTINLNRQTAMQYDQNTNLILVTYPTVSNGTKVINIKKRYQYDNSNRVVADIQESSVNANNETKSEYLGNYYEYDGMGRVVKSYTSEAIEKNAEGKYVLKSSNTVKYCTEYNYNLYGELISVKYSTGEKETASYDKNGNLIAIVNKRGGVTNYWYDELNRKIITRSGTVGDYTGNVTAYFKNGLVQAKILPSKVVENQMFTELKLEADGFPIVSALLNQPNNKYLYSYTEAGQVKEIRDSLSLKETYEYNDDGTLQQKTLKTGAVEHYTYESVTKQLLSQTVKIENLVLQSSSYKYNAQGKLLGYYTGVENNLIRRNEYDSWGNLKEEYNNDNKTSYQYNILNLPTNITYPDGRIETLSYDQFLLPDSKKITTGLDTKYSTQSYTYDALNSGRLKKIEGESDFDGFSITEDYAYDYGGALYQYTSSATLGDASIQDLGYTTEYKHDYNLTAGVAIGNDYLKLPGTNGYIAYNRDTFGRLTSIGASLTDYLYSVKYKNGNITSMSSVIGEKSTFIYDNLNRVSKYNVFNDKLVEQFSLQNEYDTKGTDNLIKESIISTPNATAYSNSYSFDSINRLTSYTVFGQHYKNAGGFEQERNIISNDYSKKISESLRDNRLWLHETPIEKTTDNQYTLLETVNERVINQDAQSLIIIYKETINNVKIVAIKNAEGSNILVKGMFSLSYKESADTNSTEINDFTIESKNGFSNIIFNDPIDNVKELKIHFYRDEFNPEKFVEDNFANLTDNTNDEDDVTYDVRYKAIYNDKIKFDETKDILGDIKTVVKVYTLASKSEDTICYDTANNINTRGDNQSPNYSSVKNRITSIPGGYIAYDNMGRMVVKADSDGTWIYRYNLDGRLWKVYRNYYKIKELGSQFVLISDDYEYVANKFKLVEENYYNTAGLLVYQKINPDESTLIKEVVYYRTPFGYQGVKEKNGKTRYLLNYLSSSGAVTANFESANQSFGNNDSTYTSGMSSYNGSNFGAERGVMNQQIPITIDGQALGELFDSSINFTDKITIKWATDISQDLTNHEISVIKECSKLKSNVYDYHRDTRGSVRLVTKNGTDGCVKLWEGSYTPYGELLTEDYTHEYLPLKTFALHETDLSTGLVYAQQRWLMPEIGAFISEDPARDGVNWYSYCGGNPVGMVDPSGLNSEDYNGSNYRDENGKTKTPGGDSLPSDRNSGDRQSDSNGKSTNDTDMSYRATRNDTNDAYNGKNYINNGTPDNNGVWSYKGGNILPDKLTPIESTANNEKELLNKLLQTDPSLNLNNTKMHDTGCNLRSLMAIAEDFTGKNLTADQINNLRETLTTNKDPALTNDTSSVNAINLSVNNADTVINKALETLGDTNHYATVGYGANGKEPSYTILIGNTNAVALGGRHFREGNSSGNMIFDPSPNVPITSEDSIRPVYIHSK
ncbi:MAG: hypothetical protein A2015_14600 [Spirochaetes bacterium GWF1_31_7]|nr:MAG: hypothetical protein A2Y30_10285 [Spirochaetes bacterium GWE1_32_154]OHD51708.1 MAG: hypothetical protein A2015_14600 [Spirochaetes bacterium GWF1_31_7]OHD53010.1 MAG: hypothetical protein A2Y29_05025 [Spirochaetes bacterium GWE2_31_10]OHD79025.1 MAG: hypothetical protein A2355_03235 [Spirochaetes bacterium RIFOXYB1_FULL_32_8]HBD92703.1 hypothetical protein [Spirochaetia bacterium]